MDGRTFLPVRAVSQALDVPVDFNPATNTVYLGNRLAGQRAPLRQAAPFFDRNPNRDTSDGVGRTSGVRFVDSINMSGIQYSNPLIFMRNWCTGTPIQTTLQPHPTMLKSKGIKEYLSHKILTVVEG